MSATAILQARTARESRGPLAECFDALGESHNEYVFDAIERLVQAGEQVGFSGQDLVRMLKGGMSLEALLDLIEVRMTANSAHIGSRAA
jgi:hypothetical protein